MVERWLIPSWYDPVVQLVLRCFELLGVEKSSRVMSSVVS